MKKLGILILCILFIGCTKNSTTKMKDLSLLNKNDIDNYVKENNLNVEYIDIYSNIDKGKVVSQSINSGDIIHDGDNLIIEL